MATLLLIEDDVDSRRALEVLLAKGGHTIFSASDGRHALKLLETMRPDVIVLDLVMPLMGGIEFYASLKHVPRLANIPVIVCTAAPPQMVAMVKAVQPPSAYLQKPVDLREMLDVIQDVLTQRRTAPK